VELVAPISQRRESASVLSRFPVVGAEPYTWWMPSLHLFGDKMMLVLVQTMTSASRPKVFPTMAGLKELAL